jgi:ABC-2 type transport system ATP-binding protein
VRARAVRVWRGAREVLHGASFDLPAGGITGLIGPSGGGKTTLMRAIVGVQRRVRGEITVLGMAAGSASLRRRVGYATQTQAAYEDLSVGENLAYFAALLGATRAQVDALLVRVDLQDTTGQLVRSLSRGCWYSMSPPSAWTRCCASACGVCFASWRQRDRRCSCPVM